MSETILRLVLTGAQVCLVLSMCLATLRALRGPRAQDRVLALDSLYIAAMQLLMVTGMRVGTPYFFEAALVIGGLGFVTTVAMAKFLLRGEVIE